MTKFMKEKWAQYKVSKAYSLWDCYQSFSSAKAAAWDHCERLCRSFDGTDLRVLTYSIFQFTAGFTFVNKHGEECFFVITQCREAWAPIREIES